ncbi:hypothetical protein ACIGEZ_32015 [Streptomyces sp. NPDC085481]|uniref:hypothetical protein n=1 Tax=Streptomyces sp. NPDC085481 TaxID=3365727 RepID=UPI0037D1A40C
MSHTLVHEVETILAQAGFGPAGGLTMHSHGDAVIVRWHADRLLRPTITAHAADPDLDTTAAITGIRTALDTALTSVLRAAGLATAAHPDGIILVTRQPRRTDRPS